MQFQSRQFVEDKGTSIFNTKPDSDGNYEFDVTDLMRYSEIKIVFSDSQITKYDRVSCRGTELLKFVPQSLQTVSPKDQIFFYERNIRNLSTGMSIRFPDYDTTEITVINSRIQIIKMSKFLQKYENLTEK